MEIPNAFIGQPAQPTDAEIAAALGPTAETWKQLLDWLAAQGASIQEWKSSSPKYGWSLLLKLKKRTIVYLAPCDGCFRVAFVLGDRAVAAARQGDLPKPVLKLLDEATHYAEGTGLRLVVKALAFIDGSGEVAAFELGDKLVGFDVIASVDENAPDRRAYLGGDVSLVDGIKDGVCCYDAVERADARCFHLDWRGRFFFGALFGFGLAAARKQQAAKRRAGRCDS